MRYKENHWTIKYWSRYLFKMPEIYHLKTFRGYFSEPCDVIVCLHLYSLIVFHVVTANQNSNE